jgi:hypothetical protein
MNEAGGRFAHGCLVLWGVSVAFLVQKGWRDQDIYERKTPIMKGAVLTRLQVLALYRVLYLQKQIFIP